MKGIFQIMAKKDIVNHVDKNRFIQIIQVKQNNINLY